jgi:hypothetical protein
MALLRGNLHSHTTFSDGVLAPAALVALYERLGYDFLAITDHDDRIDAGYWQALGRLAPRLILLRGVELSGPALPQHVGMVVGERETLYVLNHPARYGLSVDDTVVRVRELRARGLRLDAVEVTDTGRYCPLYDTGAIPLVKVATDDAHRPGHVGRAWIEVEAARNPDAILRAIRAGEVRLGFDRAAGERSQRVRRIATAEAQQPP